MFLPTVLVLVVCSIHSSTAAPTPGAPTMNQNLKEDVLTVLRELLINRGQTTLDQWFRPTGDSNKEQDSSASQDQVSTASQDQNSTASQSPDYTASQGQDDEQFSTQAALTDAPESTITSLPPPPPPSPPKPPIHPICKKRLNNPDRIEDIRDIRTRRDVIEYLIYRLCIPTITAEDVLAVSLIVDRLNNRGTWPIIGLPNPFEPEVVTPPDSDNNVNDQESDNKDLMRKRTDDNDIDEEDEGDQATPAPALQPVQILHPLCMNRLNNPNQIKTIGEVLNRHDAIEYLIYRLCLPGVTAEDIEAVADIVGGLPWPVAFMPRERQGQNKTTSSYNVQNTSKQAQNYETKSSTLDKQTVYKYTSNEEEEEEKKDTPVDMELMIRHLLGELIN
ncbi:uncharacterized protein LOC121428631 isoform X2 [Lytechinus variegatus]|uniref:uncharacterized protein LOC121428631 isoform X2 n=1 Tax=Lytechinus variegatus TaxID=7654 RepID=UPI001BB16994|nr:uncharacterized protein LOC121428631 isoform X2 [Lytechinus variegatus]